MGTRIVLASWAFFFFSTSFADKPRSLDIALQPVPGYAHSEERALANQVVPVPVVAEDPGVFKSLVLKYLPTDFTKFKSNPDGARDPDSVSRDLQKGVTQKVSEDIFGSRFFKKNSFGKFVDRVKDATSRSFAFYGAKKESPPLEFKVEAYKGQAGFHYAGYFESALNFVGQDRNVQFVLSKELAKDTFVLLKEESPVSGFDLSSRLELGLHF